MAGTTADWPDRLPSKEQVMNHQPRRSSAVLTLAALAGCATAGPAAPPYEPSFSYSISPGGQKLDVTIGVIAPQFSAQSGIYWQSNKDDQVIKGMLSAVSSTFAELVSAKGFNTKGPFSSTNDLTFPDKKGSDLLLFPEFDFQVTLGRDNVTQKAQAIGILTGQTTKLVCDMVISVTGNVNFVVTEPLSGERMWIKRLDVSGAKQVVKDQDVGCQGGPISQETRNAWVKAHETLYQTTVAALDKYVNGEEFQGLKRQSQELRARKAY
jgi:hypothetical protein